MDSNKHWRLMNRNRLLGILGVFLILFSAVAQAAAAMQTVSAATEITSATGNKKTDPTRDDGVPLSADTFYEGATYPITYNWYVPASATVNDGDQLTFTVPDGALFSGDTNIAVYNSTGAVIGTFSSGRGQSTGILTFNNYFATHAGSLSGQLHVTVYGTVHRDVSEVTMSKASVLDTSTLDANGRYTRINWTVAVNNFRDTVRDLVLTDNYAAESKAPIDQSQVAVEYGSNPKTTVPSDLYTLTWQSTGGFVFTYHGILAQQIIISYHSNITKESDPGYVLYGQKSTYDNTATMTGFDETQAALGKESDMSKMINYGHAGPSVGADGTGDSHPPITIAVSKQWTGVPSGVTTPPIVAELYKNGTATGDTVTLNEANHYTGSFANEPTFEDGKYNVYTVQEQSVPDGYVTTTPGPQSLVNNGVVLKNTYNTPQTIHVQKKWTGAPSGVTKPPVTAVLYRNNTATDQTVKLDAANNYQADFANLPTYDDTGNPYTYTVSEDTTPAGYTNATPGQQKPNEQNQVILQNAYIPQQSTITVQKQWLGVPEADQHNRPAVTAVLYKNGQKTDTTVVLNEANNFTGTFSNLAETDADGQTIAYTVGEAAVPAGYSQVTNQPVAPDAKGSVTLVNQYIPLTTITAKKTWQGVSEGVTPPDITAKLYADGQDTGKTVQLTAANQYQADFTDLPTQKMDGSAIAYSVGEASVPAGYQTSQTTPVAVSAGGTAELINTYIPQTTAITVHKQWQNVPTGVTPPDVLAVLYANGQKTAQTVTLTSKNDYQDRFTDLPTTDAAGKAITYTVAEETVPTGYTTTTAGEQSPVAGVVTLVNAYTVQPPVTETTSITVKKQWQNVPAGVTAPAVTATIYANGQSTGKQVTLSQANDYQAAVTDLPKTDAAGQAITYTVVEDPAAGDYTVVMTGPQTPDKTGLVTLINQYKTQPPVVETTQITVQKRWQDVPSGVTPPAVIATIYANGQSTG